MLNRLITKQIVNSKINEFENQLNDYKGSKSSKTLIEVVSCVEKSNDTHILRNLRLYL